MKTRSIVTIVLATILLSFAAALAQEQGDRSQAIADAAAAEKTVEKFHAALEAGDSTAAAAFLASDLMVLESGWMETRDEYLSHHLGADMEFAAATEGARNLHRAVVAGNAAWVIATSSAQGTFRENEINSAGVELIVLGRENADTPWQIRAIHWSSRKVKE